MTQKMEDRIFVVAKQYLRLLLSSISASSHNIEQEYELVDVECWNLNEAWPSSICVCFFSFLVPGNFYLSLFLVGVYGSRHRV